MFALDGHTKASYAYLSLRSADVVYLVNNVRNQVVVYEHLKLSVKQVQQKLDEPGSSSFQWNAWQLDNMFKLAKDPVSFKHQFDWCRDAEDQKLLRLELLRYYGSKKIRICVCKHCQNTNVFASKQQTVLGFESFPEVFEPDPLRVLSKAKSKALAQTKK